MQNSLQTTTATTKKTLIFGHKTFFQCMYVCALNLHTQLFLHSNNEFWYFSSMSLRLSLSCLRACVYVFDRVLMISFEFLLLLKKKIFRWMNDFWRGIGGIHNLDTPREQQKFVTTYYSLWWNSWNRRKFFLLHFTCGPVWFFFLSFNTQTYFRFCLHYFFFFCIAMKLRIPHLNALKFNQMW